MVKVNDKKSSRYKDYKTVITKLKDKEIKRKNKVKILVSIYLKTLDKEFYINIRFTIRNTKSSR